MEQIASLRKLEKHLKAIRLVDNYIDIQNLITELHFACESFRIAKVSPTLDDQRTLLDCAYYLFTALTNPQRRSTLSASDVEDGLSISGLVFELIGRYAESSDQLDLRRECYLNASIANTLSRFEANATVLASDFFVNKQIPNGKQDFLARSAEYGINIVFALLAREFFWIQRNRLVIVDIMDETPVILRSLDDLEGIYIPESGFWAIACRAIASFTDFMINGHTSSYTQALQNANEARRIAREADLLFEHWAASRLIDCFNHMQERSCWRVLLTQGFSENYISALTRFPWNAVHELWTSQIEALTKMENVSQPDKKNYLDDGVNRVIVSMPTSAGKTLVAELAIVKMLESRPGTKCVYVAPTRALVDEIEVKLHRRLRFLGYRVASVVGAFEVSVFEENYLSSIDVAVLTPEKLDYLVRKREPFIDKVALIVFDETHKVAEGERGWFLETLITWIMLKPSLANVKMVFMSAVLSRIQTPLLRQWIGYATLAPLISTNWSPTRQLIAVAWYSDVKIDWNHPIDTDKEGNRCYLGKSTNLTFRYNIGNSHRQLMDIYRTGRFWVDDAYRQVKTEKETRYDRCLNLIRHLGLNNSTLVYFHEKIDLIRFCRRVETAGFNRIADSRLDRLIQYISMRLGDGFPMRASLPFGVGFHHGDLPPDVRTEIENAYRDKVIRVLACTTTLAEGVNLPVETFILGYHETNTGYHLSVRDFKNIIGRAGRALVETEGKIIAIRHPEFDNFKSDEGKKKANRFDTLVRMDDKALTVISAFQPDRTLKTRRQVVHELNLLAQSIKSEEDLAKAEYDEKLAERIQRLQVFIFTLIEDHLIDATPASIRSALQHTLLFTKQRERNLIESVIKLCQQFAIVSSQMDSIRLRRFNSSGMHYRSNSLLEQRAELIVDRCNELSVDEYSFERVITPSDLQFLLDNIRETRIRVKDFREKYEIVAQINHYDMLVRWRMGEDFSAIRDRFFMGIKDISERTSTCQSYISKMYNFRLPWAFAALGEHIKRFGNSLLGLWFETIPAQVKYGVDTPEAVFFSSIGIQSRLLANRLGQLYRSEIGTMSEVDWHPLEDWFVNLSPFDLREKATDLPDLAIRQAIRRINSVRRPSEHIQRTKGIEFNIAGWQYCSGEKFLDKAFESLRLGERPRLELFHEFDNEYDDYAIGIHWGSPSAENKLGYVPRTYNEEIAELLAMGRRLETQLVSLASSVSDSGWRRASVQIKLSQE